MFGPTESPVTLVFANEAFVNVPVPEITLQDPPVAAVAAKVVELLQMVWSIPAFGVIGLASTSMLTSSNEGAQTPFEIVHLNTLVPVDNPETEVFDKLELAKVPLPEMTVQTPLPIVGTLPSSVVTVAQMVWSSPAKAVVGCD
jgi:hypothetical protein